MKTIAQSAITTSLAVALLAGCGGSQPTGSGVVPKAPAFAAHSTSSSYKVLYVFGRQRDAKAPEAGLINVKGTLYGTTIEGGAHRHGAVFTITTGGAERVLYSFKGFPDDGEHPKANLVDVSGTLYGTTTGGGSANYGTVFSVTPSGTETVLYSFGGKPDARRPNAGLINVGGTLYGTSNEGGDYKRGIRGAGTVFSVTTNGTEKVMHTFCLGNNDGCYPYAPLIDVGGTLYGTTYGGGAYRNGTVFTITTSGTERVLYSFKGGSDGAEPLAGLVDVGGTFYGTTSQGGAGHGTVFSISPDGTEKVLHSFNGDGANPESGLIAVKGTLYGTTYLGGTHGDGTVFSVTASGTEHVLHSMNGYSDGYSPLTSLIEVNGTLYGTTTWGSTYESGTVFSLKL